MSRIFISHSSKDNFAAVALGGWLKDEGWDDCFLDLDPGQGIRPGERWERALYNQAADCEAVLYLVSRNWLASEWCRREFELARKLNKRIFVVLIENIAVDDLPDYLKETHQAVSLAAGEDHRVFHPKMPVTHVEGHVTFSAEGLSRLKNGLNQAGLDPRFFAWPPENEPDRAPYRGLEPMEALDAGVFFGRDGPIIEALDALRGLREATRPRLLVILGASGAGKSSFLRAGLLPRLARDDRNFFTLPPIRPERAALSGANGFIAALAAAAVRQGLVISRAQIRDAAAKGAAAVRPILQELVARAGADKPPTLVITIDQAEELFRAEGLVEGESFLTLLRDLATQDEPAVIAVFAIRSDSYDALEHSKPLEGLRQKAFPLLPMPRGAFQTVIEGPAKRLAQAGTKFEIESGLTQALLEDIEKGGGSDALPLLSFTLEQLFHDHGAANRLSRENYVAFGGLKGALDAALARVFFEADKDSRIPRVHEARLALLRRGLIPWLAGVDPETRTVRRRVAGAGQIPEEARPLVELLVEQRLLTRDIDEKTGEATIEPAHEALLRQWGGLKNWLEEDFGRLATLEGVKRAARDWDANARETAWAAHGGARLEEAGRLDTRPDLAEMLDATDRAYLAACREKESAAREAEQARLRAEASNARNVRRVAWVSTVGAVVALILAGLAGWQGWLAHRSAESAAFEGAKARKSAEIADVEANKAKEQRASAQVKESLLLAQQSREQADKGLPLAAVQLALRGLPRMGDRPFVAETGGALLESLGDQNVRHILSGHKKYVSSAVFSFDGKRIVTASWDTTARLWDVATGEELFVLAANQGAYEAQIPQVQSAVFSSDGMRVVTASANAARVWDAATGKQLAVLREKEGGLINQAAFSPDGMSIVTASVGKIARLWTTTGEELAALRGHEDDVVSAVFSPDGKRVVTASFDKTARLWDAMTGKELAVLRGHEDVVWSAVFSPDGGRVVTASLDKTARLWDAATGKELAVLRGHEGNVISAVFSPDGRRVVTASLDKTARLWDVATGKELAVLRGHGSGVMSAVFSPDGGRVVTTSLDKTARLWDAETGEERDVLRGHTDGVFSAVFSPDGAFVLTCSMDNTAWLWDSVTETKERFTTHGLSDFVLPTIFAPDGTRFVADSSQGKTVPIVDTETEKKIVVLQGHDASIRSTVFSPDGKLVATASWDKTARLWDAVTGKGQVILRGHEGPVESVAFSPDGKLVATASWDGTARLWDAVTGKEQVILHGHEGYLFSAIFSPDGGRVVTTSLDKTARLWDAATGKELAVLRGHKDVVHSAVFSPDGRRVVTTSLDNTARLWDASSGKELAVLRADSSFFFAVFSPDGRRIFTLSSDKTARLWDAVTAEQQAVLRVDKVGANAAAFSRDSLRLLIITNQGKICIIRIGHSMEEAIELAHNTLPRELTPEEELKFYLTTGTP